MRYTVSSSSNREGFAVTHTSSVDMRRANQAGTKPLLPCLDVLHEDILLACLDVQTQSQPGRGFSTLISGGLHADLHENLIFLCSIDVLMSQNRDGIPSSYNKSHLIQARDLAHHRILSVESWDRLEVDERGGGPRQIYECCRLTARLYSTAVLWGMPMDTAWHHDIVRQVAKLLEVSEFHCWPHTQCELLLWILVVNGVASYGSMSRRFFEEGLGVMLEKTGVGAFDHLKQVVSAFLWSDNACVDGAKMLWDAVVDGRIWQSEDEIGRALMKHPSPLTRHQDDVHGG